jgi:hypothetical protein
MDAKKNCKILFNSLIQKMYLENDGDEVITKPLYLIDELISYIITFKKKERFFDLKDNKFCFIESATVSEEKENKKLIQGYFISARNQFRPNLINKKTGQVRKNPKELSEGDIEKTHFIISIDKNNEEVYLFLEHNYHGVNQNSIINYFTKFLKQDFKEKKRTKNFSIQYLIIARTDFLVELEKVKRTVLAEIYFDKKLLGSNALNFSNRTISLKKDLKLVASASPKESITEVAIDCYNNLNSKNSDISKVRIYAKDINGNDLILDTSFMGLIEFVEVELNQETGEVNTTQLLSSLKIITENF